MSLSCVSSCCNAGKSTNMQYLKTAHDHIPLLEQTLFEEGSFWVPQLFLGL